MAFFDRRNLFFIFIALTPLFSIFFIIPFELFHPQIEAWNYETLLPFVIAGIGCLIYAIIIPVLIIIARLHRRAFENCTLLLCGIGLLAVVADIYAPIQLAPLDGRKLFSPEPFRLTLVEMFFATTIFVAVPLILSRRNLLEAARYVSLSITLIAAVYSGLVLATNPPDFEARARPKTFPTLPGNVYHIVLDEMQSDAALLYLKETKSQKHFDGFTIFPYNHSNYLYTPPSFASYITGATYNGIGSLADWKKTFKGEGIFQDVLNAGYKVSMFSPRREWVNPAVASFILNDSILSEDAGGTSSQLRDFFQLWFARFAPNALTNEAIELGEELSNRLFSFTRGNASCPDTIEHGREPYSSALMLRYLKNAEVSRPPNGEYVYAHAIIPHGPYVMNANCDYRKFMPQARTSSYYQQVHCAFLRVIEFVDELKRLNRYDDATIIIHADTGHGFRGFLSKRNGLIQGSVKNERKKRRPSFLKNRNGWTDNQIAARSLAFLMIKPARARGNLTLSDVKSQLIDLRPTVQSLIGYAPSEQSARLEGVSVFSPTFPAKRPHLVYYYDDMAIEPKLHPIVLTGGPLYRHMERIMAKSPRH